MMQRERNNFFIGDKSYTHETLLSLSLYELIELSSEIQNEIRRCALIRKKLLIEYKTTKDKKTSYCISKLTTKISRLQSFANVVSGCRKIARDTQSKERDFYKTFFKIISESVNKKAFAKLVAETEEKCGYSIDYYIG